MKKFLSLIILVIVSLSFASCKDEKEVEEEVFAFYSAKGEFGEWKISDVYISLIDDKEFYSLGQIEYTGKNSEKEDIDIYLIVEGNDEIRSLVGFSSNISDFDLNKSFSSIYGPIDNGTIEMFENIHDYEFYVEIKYKENDVIKEIKIPLELRKVIKTQK